MTDARLECQYCGLPAAYHDEFQMCTQAAPSDARERLAKALMVLVDYEATYTVTGAVADAIIRTIRDESGNGWAKRIEVREAAYERGVREFAAWADERVLIVASRNSENPEERWNCCTVDELVKQFLASRGREGDT
jgi:hypothetical protein